VTAGRRAPVPARIGLLFGGAILGCFVGVGCRSVSDEEATAATAAARRGPVMPPPWTINGARTSMTRAEVVALHGEPDKESGYPNRRTATWTAIDLWVTFDGEGRAMDITGSTLQTLDGRTVVSRGMPEEEVVARSGEGNVRGSYQTGSGVISLGYKRVGAEHRFTDDTTRYGLGVSEGSLKFIRAQRLPVAEP